MEQKSHKRKNKKKQSLTQNKTYFAWIGKEKL